MWANCLLLMKSNMGHGPIFSWAILHQAVKDCKTLSLYVKDNRGAPWCLLVGDQHRLDPRIVSNFS
jgi:hypothetical protein